MFKVLPAERFSELSTVLGKGTGRNRRPLSFLFLERERGEEGNFLFSPYSWESR
jgi:hypothetical protein